LVELGNKILLQELVLNGDLKKASMKHTKLICRMRVNTMILVNIGEDILKYGKNCKLVYIMII